MSVLTEQFERDFRNHKKKQTELKKTLIFLKIMITLSIIMLGFLILFPFILHIPYIKDVILFLKAPLGSKSGDYFQFLGTCFIILVTVELAFFSIKIEKEKELKENKSNMISLYNDLSLFKDELRSLISKPSYLFSLDFKRKLNTSFRKITNIYRRL